MAMPGMERPYRWDLEDMVEQEMASTSLKTTLPRSLPRNMDPEPRSIPQHKSTPLLKRATAQDLQAARSIVNKALAKSSELNKARVADPLRNKYGLKSGTVVGGGSVPGGGSSLASSNQDVPPLLVITDEIAAAAALVAEAEATGQSRNVTKRAAASVGTYWMER